MSNPIDPKVRQTAQRLTKKLADDGLLIEAGWQVYRLLLLRIPPHETRDDLYEAYQAGAEHVFGSMFNMLDIEREPTEADMKRMDLLITEVELIHKRLDLKYGRSRGNA